MPFPRNVKRRLLLVGAASALLGAIYLMSRGWFDFTFLGPKQGSERGIVTAWSAVAIALGVVSAVSAFGAHKLLVPQSAVSLSAVLLLQGPPLVMWLFVGMIHPTAFFVWRAVFTHVVMTVLAFNAILAVRREYLARAAGSAPNGTDDL